MQHISIFRYNRAFSMLKSLYLQRVWYFIADCTFHSFIHIGILPKKGSGVRGCVRERGEGTLPLVTRLECARSGPVVVGCSWGWHYDTFLALLIATAAMMPHWPSRLRA